MNFIDALEQGNLKAIRECPKADLHNHFVLGGSRKYLKEQTGRDIRPITEPLHSMNDMHAWNGQNIGNYFDSPEGRRQLIKATFTQAIRPFSTGILRSWWRRLKRPTGRLHRRLS